MDFPQYKCDSHSTKLPTHTYTNTNTQRETQKRCQSFFPYSESAKKGVKTSIQLNILIILEKRYAVKINKFKKKKN